jgi:hypothetical protein
MANLSVVRTALAQVVQENTFPALSARGDMPDAVNPPCALVVPAKSFIKYGITLTGDVLNGPVLTPTEFNLDVLVIVARVADQNQIQANLDQWLGFELDADVVSVPMAIAMNPTLNGTVQYCEVMTADSYAPIEWNNVMYFGARIHTIVSLM